jgi:hypothetical protein
VVARVNVTDHAFMRWRERIDARAEDADIYAAIAAHVEAIEKALAFGCARLKIGGNITLVVAADRIAASVCVVTVVPSRDYRAGHVANKRALLRRKARPNMEDWSNDY